MTDIKYDPELPYAIKYKDQVWARFLSESDAHSYVEREGGTVVDTTPKPKIPDDAEFVTWRKDVNSVLEFAENTQGYWSWSGLEISEGALIEAIGDAEVTVLVRKEDA